MDDGNITKELLHRAHSPDTAETIYKDIIYRPLLLKPTTAEDQPLTAREARRRQREAKAAAKARKRRKPAPLSARQKRALCVHEIPPSQRKWDIFLPLHELWLGYVRSVLGVDSEGRKKLDPSFAGSTLTNADLHGALVEVVKSRCVGRVGIAGIVCKETRGTFEIITKANEIKVVPKEFTTFRLEIPVEGEDDLVFEIIGDQFIARPAERATRKFKIKIPKDV